MRSEPVWQRRLTAGRNAEPPAQSGLGRDHFSRIENVVRIERALERAHEIDLGRAFVAQISSRFITPMPCSALIEPPKSCTMSCTMRAGSRPSARGTPRIAALRRAEIEMDVAVAEMAEGTGRAPGTSFSHGCGALRRGSPGCCDRHRDVVLDRGAFGLLRFGHAFAQLPQSGALRLASRDDAHP